MLEPQRYIIQLRLLLGNITLKLGHLRQVLCVHFGFRVTLLIFEVLDLSQVVFDVEHFPFDLLLVLLDCVSDVTQHLLFFFAARPIIVTGLLHFLLELAIVLNTSEVKDDS